MKLTDLKPRWVGRKYAEWWPEIEGSIKVGLVFNCPHCAGADKPQRLAVFFKPVIDRESLADKVAWALPGAPNPNNGELPHINFWQRTGETFEDMTLSPSIDASGPKWAYGPHWHGFITNGEISP